MITTPDITQNETLLTILWPQETAPGDVYPLYG